MMNMNIYLFLFLLNLSLNLEKTKTPTVNPIKPISTTPSEMPIASRKLHPVSFTKATAIDEDITETATIMYRLIDLLSIFINPSSSYAPFSFDKLGGPGSHKSFDLLQQHLRRFLPQKYLIREEWKAALPLHLQSHPR
ncbi:MAG: hypothetical protein ACR2PC_13900 [Tsuneonella suprasediminis]|uniref:hypothetical protein n=1 Tax=Tsuneonella suprasediminis TaxID=2306996 RepID=UPI00105902C0|nr:hypothetical protein [Tsuneonella suprasediminis]UBS31976.1 hypothetical protein LBX01_10725 [Altererythrobacter sp. N1]